MQNNLLLATDVYKFGHLYQYPEGTTKVYSYLQARSDKHNDYTIFFGLQYYLQRYFSQKVTAENVKEFTATVEAVLGPNMVDESHYMKLVELGYLPLEIKAVPEGTKIPIRNVLMTITNTHPDFAWLVGFVESLILKVWYPCTIATNSHELYRTCKKYAEHTCDDLEHLSFQIHDFGYRGCSSEETAAIGGAAHLISGFLGTDNVPAVGFLKQYYCSELQKSPIGLSVPATEHSVMCAYGESYELEAFQEMIKRYPTGIVSIVSDTYNLWNVLFHYTDVLRDSIMERDGKVVFRPDSGYPPDIICGTANGRGERPAEKGALQLLWEKFGGTVNSKGLKVLDPHVGLIYGDGITPERMEQIFNRMLEMGFASSNIVFGVGGLLLQNFNRDTFGFALKATYCEVNGQSREIVKDPVTDSAKKSHKGRLCLHYDDDKGFWTEDQVSYKEEMYNTELSTVFYNGNIYKESLELIRQRVV